MWSLVDGSNSLTETISLVWSFSNRGKRYDLYMRVKICLIKNNDTRTVTTMCQASEMSEVLYKVCI